MSTISLQEAIQEIEKIANEKHDGHYTIMKFTTGYKVVFGTPEMRHDYYGWLYEQPIYENVVTAILQSIENTV